MEFLTTLFQNNKKWLFVGACVVLILGMLAFGLDPTEIWNMAFGIAGS